MKHAVHLSNAAPELTLRGAVAISELFGHTLVMVTPDDLETPGDSTEITESESDTEASDSVSIGFQVEK